ncbi:RagB/SusD family nutrient uptake outer membrane protein, partial [uncultured Duncaniella sp.]
LYAGSNANKPYSSADCIVYRLGETYLLSAEAAWRLGDNQKAAVRINELRNRACRNHDHSLDIPPGSIDVDFILDEYARELIGEWTRWSTLKRFRALEERIAKANPQITAFNKDIHYLRPVPLAEIQSIDNPNEYQNPGY